MSTIVDDADNPTGPTATPIVFTNITIWGYGATFERNSSRNFRLFAVHPLGHLTIKKAYIRGFYAQGGNGGNGGGGGMGAGGAIYVMNGGLVVEASTFEGNWAVGGTGGGGRSGGGGGLGGNGGPGFEVTGRFTGAGGGGARGHGSATGAGNPDGGGGGGTVRNASGTLGGYSCGANGTHGDGQNAPCAGGGGSGGAIDLFSFVDHSGGAGNYGGGGGGGNFDAGGSGGRGGFGGGGGASGYAGYFGEDGGNGGFGGGGGVGTNGDITDGDPGNGGFFAGHATSSGGGGGAGLGGAIFNDGGDVQIRNSTFVGNIAIGGQSTYGRGASGGGGAIFSRNGHLSVLNATISLNEAVFGIGGGIMVAQDSVSASTSFVLQNTIVANNGPRECAVTGSSIAGSFTGNLIVSNADGSEFRDRTFVPCPGVAATGDPQLAPLAYNLGPTPTMAISTSSPAWNAADFATSLGFDQRGQRRPALGGVDIGAFELCLQTFLTEQIPCTIFGFEESPGGTQPVLLTMEVNPAGGGTTTPASGTSSVTADTPVSVTATPNAGYRFAGWSQNVADPVNPSTTVFMATSQIVTAYFESCACAENVTSSIGITYSGITINPITRRYVQTLTLKNNAGASIAGPISLVLDKLTAGVSLYNATGTTSLLLPSGSPYIDINTTLAAGQSVTVQLQFTNAVNVGFTYEARVVAGPGSR